MPIGRFLSLSKGIRTEKSLGGELALVTPGYSLRLQSCPSYILDGLSSLADPGTAEGELTDFIYKAGGAEGLAFWYHQLQSLARRGLLQISVVVDKNPIATLEPMSDEFLFEPKTGPRDGTYVLSRFAYLRRDGSDFLLESPRSLARLVIHEPSVMAFMESIRLPMKSENAGTDDLKRSLLSLFIDAAMVTEVTPDGVPTEDKDSSVVTWDFHDLLFHARSRPGRHNYKSGAVFPHPDRLAPALKERSNVSSQSIALYKPSLKELEEKDDPFCVVQERRKSQCKYSEAPLSVTQLGEFLFRVARIKGMGERSLDTPHGPVNVEFTARPYPAGGSLYELEFYIVVHRCEGVAAGMYHYDPLNHCLDRLKEQTAEVRGLLRDAATASMMDFSKLQILIILAARPQRLSWKYGSIAYALILKNVGVVYQTMYLAASAMGLAPCGLGSGNSRLFARATGLLNDCEETSVGEFILGNGIT